MDPLAASTDILTYCPRWLRALWVLVCPLWFIACLLAALLESVELGYVSLWSFAAGAVVTAIAWGWAAIAKMNSKGG